VKIFRDLLKKSGLPVQKYQVTREEAAKNAQAMLASQGVPQLPQPGMPQQGAPVPMAAPGIPSAGEVPPIPPATPPQLTGTTLQ